MARLRKQGVAMMKRAYFLALAKRGRGGAARRAVTERG
jgi:hypothetical protein